MVKKFLLCANDMVQLIVACVPRVESIPYPLSLEFLQGILQTLISIKKVS